MSLFFSHIRLAQTPAAHALARLLAPSNPAARRSAQHNLLWSIFSDGPERRRDFLWREDGDGSLLALSARPPAPLELFEPHKVRDFAPALTAGDVLAFQLRCNATRTKRNGKRVDIVMDTLHSVPTEQRGMQRMALATREGATWLERQGAKAGFRLLEAQAEEYSVQVLPGHRGPRKGQPQFGILDLSGKIEVTDPTAFMHQIGLGFGRAKAFGCGLMLIRRTA